MNGHSRGNDHLEPPILHLFHRMGQYYLCSPLLQADCLQWGEWQDLFLCKVDKPLPIVVFLNIKPTQTNIFLIHIVLSLGNFMNEYDLFGNSHDIRSAFITSRLINPSDLEGSTNQLVHHYICEQLVYMPGGTCVFDQLCIAADVVLREVIESGNLVVAEMPSVLYTSLCRHMVDHVEAFLQSIREQLAKVTVTKLCADGVYDGMPDAMVFVSATKANPIGIDFNLQQGQYQLDDSYLEQKTCIAMGRCLFRQYMSAPMLQVKSLCIVGGPGCGKTTVMRLLQMDSIGLGLSTMTTTLLCERALELGSIHWHKLASLPVNEYCALQWIAELALFALFQKPERMAMLQRLDMLCIDELGQLSAGQIACLNVILHQIRGSSKFFGGIVVVVTMDPCQLKPIKSDPTMLSPLMITAFNFHCLEHSVWAGRDLVGYRKLQNGSQLLHTQCPG